MQKKVTVMINEALENKEMAKQIMKDPAAAFLKVGVEIPKGQEADFNNFFNETLDELSTTLETVATGGHPPVANGWVQNVACMACKINVWGIAIGFIGSGIGGMATLTLASPATIALAGIFGISATTLLTFLKEDLVKILKNGVPAVATAICHFVKVC